MEVAIARSSCSCSCFIQSLRVGGFTYLLCTRRVARPHQAAQVDIVFDICNLVIVNYIRIELQRGLRSHTGAAQQRSHIRQMLCVVPALPALLAPLPFPFPHARFFVSLPSFDPSGVAFCSAACEACAVIAAICCPAQQHYLRVLDFCAKRS